MGVGRTLRGGFHGSTTAGRHARTHQFAVGWVRQRTTPQSLRCEVLITSVYLIRRYSGSCETVSDKLQAESSKMRNSGADSYGGTGWPDRRRARVAPKARLWPGRRARYPALYPSAWYPVDTVGPRAAEYIWLQTTHGLARVDRLDVEIRATKT
jgi:hypothetical protein